MICLSLHSPATVLPQNHLTTPLQCSRPGPQWQPPTTPASNGVVRSNAVRRFVARPSRPWVPRASCPWQYRGRACPRAREGCPCTHGRDAHATICPRGHTTNELPRILQAPRSLHKHSNEPHSGPMPDKTRFFW